MHDSHRLLTTTEASKLINVSPRTLEGYRLRGGGPPFFRVGPRSVRYTVADLLAWALRERRLSTSEMSPGRPRSVATRSANHSLAPRSASLMGTRSAS